jgi:hypothetical protein
MNNETFTPLPTKNNSGNSKVKRVVIIIVITIVALGIIATAVVSALSLLKKDSTKDESIPTPKTGIRADVDETKNFEKNKTAMFGYFEVQVDKVTTDYKPGGGLTPQNPGYEFVVLTITAKNTDKIGHLLSDIDLAVLSGEDVINSSYVVFVKPVIKTSTVKPGASITGNLVYEVPPDSKDLKLYYNTRIYNNEQEKLKKIEYTLAF